MSKKTKYSTVKRKLGIETTKKVDERLAVFTHYLQNSENGSSKYYKKGAEKVLREFMDENEIVSDNDFQHYLPIKWDVPFPPPENPKFKFIDLFAGIGGIRMAFQNLGGKCVFTSEWDNAAKKTYEANFGEVPFGDITKIKESEIPDHDILLGGFPCQPFSLAGVSARTSLGRAHGFADKNQGNLFFEIVRIIKAKHPKVVFLENVKNFKNHDSGKTFQTVQAIMKSLGYDFHWKIINANVLVPQNRQRFYMVCFYGGNDKFRFPELTGTPVALSTILEKKVSKEYTISDRLWEGHQRRTKRNLARGTGFTAFTADLNKPSNTLVARYGKDGKECLIPQRGENPRKLTPRECARLQGFPENYILPKSNAAAYKQFGNSVAVPVICKIAVQIQKALRA